MKCHNKKESGWYWELGAKRSFDDSGAIKLLGFIRICLMKTMISLSFVLSFEQKGLQIFQQSNVSASWAPLDGCRYVIRESLVSITPLWQPHFFYINYLEHFGR